MAWLENAVNFIKGGIDDVRKLWINGSQKVSGMAFNADEFYDVVNNVAARKGGENGFVMLKEARDTMRDCCRLVHWQSMQMVLPQMQTKTV